MWAGEANAEGEVLFIDAEMFPLFRSFRLEPCCSVIHASVCL